MLHTVRVCWGSKWELGFSLCSTCPCVLLCTWCGPVSAQGRRKVGDTCFLISTLWASNGLGCYRGWNFHTVVQRPRGSCIQSVGSASRRPACGWSWTWGVRLCACVEWDQGPQQLILRSIESQGNQLTPGWMDKIQQKGWNRQDNRAKNQKVFTLSEYCTME